MEEDFIALFKQGYTFNEIQDKLSLSSFDYVELLKKINSQARSYINDKSFFSDGTISNMKDISNNDLSILTRPEENIFHFLVISDTHIGSLDDNLSYLDLVYDYCVKSNIYHIFHGGDLIDGNQGNTSKRLNMEEQINEVVTKYPYDNTITNFINLGNHDFDSMILDMPIDKVLIENRPDLIPLGYGTSEVKLKNDSFVINHFIPISILDCTYSRKLVLRGHSHRLKVKDDHNNYHVYIPSLSDMDFPDHFVPGFLDLTISFKRGYIDTIQIKQLGIINNKIYPLGLNELYLGYKIPKNDAGLNVMEYIKRR